MGCLEGSGVPVLYIGRTIPKGETSEMSSSWNTVKIEGPSAFETLRITVFFEHS